MEIIGKKFEHTFKALPSIKIWIPKMHDIDFGFKSYELNFYDPIPNFGDHSGRAYEDQYTNWFML